MASITKRGSSYRVRVKFKGKYYTKTFQSKALAKEWANRKEQQLKSYTSGELGKNKTVADALTKYAKEVSIHKEGLPLYWLLGCDASRGGVVCLTECYYRYIPSLR
ncbi:hypothetical protein [Kordiimonas sp.]|uniref:hypothetical protein n=1 Tax=Kordiimonas sp. TaxID=1970157 RepID=UPI003A930D31